MLKIHVTRQVYEDRGPRGHFFEKTKKHVCRYGLGEFVYIISGRYRFWFGQEVPYKATNAENQRDITVFQG